MTSKSTISLSDAQADFARALVEQGRFESVQDVLDRSIDLLRDTLDLEEADREALKAVLARRRDGPFLSASELDAALDRMLGDQP